MGLQSLRDKLLQAGLVNEQQAKKAEEDAAAERRAARARQQGRQDGRGRGGPRQGGPRQDGPRQGQGRGGPGRQEQRPPRELTPEEIQAREEEAAFRERERELNREREENRKRAAEDRRRLEGLRSLAEAHEITERGDEPFHYPSRRRKLMRIFLTPEQIGALERGELAIIDKPTPAELTQALVPREAAEQALALDPKAMRFYNRGPDETYGFQPEAPSAEDSVGASEEAEAEDVAEAQVEEG